MIVFIKDYAQKGTVVTTVVMVLEKSGKLGMLLIMKKIIAIKSLNVH